MDINNVKFLIELGYKSFHNKDYNESIKVWQPIIDFSEKEKFENVDLENIYLDLGKCYYRTQKYKKAKIVVEKGLLFYPESINLLKLKGFNDEKLQDFKSALIAWQHVLSLYPEHQEAMSCISDLHKKIKEDCEIKQERERRMQTSIDVNEILQEVNKKLNKNLLKDAESLIENSLPCYPNNHNLLIKYAQITQDLSRKTQRFLTVAILYPSSVPAILSLIDACVQSGDFASAKEYWKKFITYNQLTDYQIYQDYAENMELYSLKESFWSWLDVYRQFPHSIQAKEKVGLLEKELGLSRSIGGKLNDTQRKQQLYEINKLFIEGKSAFDKKDYEQSNKLWQKAVDLAVDKNDVPANLYLGLGKSYIRSDEFPLANIILSQAIDIYPENYNIAFLLPYLLKRQQKWQEACDAWQQLSEKFPNMISAKMELAESYKQMNELDKAKQFYQEVIQKDDNYFDAYLNLARLLMKKADFIQALQVWSQVRSRWQDKINGYLGMAICHKHLSEYDNAFWVIEWGFEVFPNNIQLLDELVDVIYRSQDYQEGYNRLEKLIFDKPEVLECQKARLLVKLKKFDEALVIWEDIKKRNPYESQSHWMIGQIYEETGQYDLAEKEFLMLVEKFPDREIGYWNMAMLKFKLQDWVRAKYYWEQYISNFPVKEDAYYNYLKVLINLNEDSITLCERIAKIINKEAKDVLLKYIYFLKNYYRFSQLELVCSELTKLYPKIRQFSEMYFSTLYYQKKWLLAKNAYSQLINHFGTKADDLMYTYLDVLWHLKEYHEMEEHYILVMKSSYPQILEYYPDYDFSLDKLAIAETVGNFENADFLRKSYKSPIATRSVKKPNFDEKIQCDYIHHDDNNQALLIFFSGLTFKTKNNFDKCQFNNFEQLKNDNKDIKSSFFRFAKKNTQYNMLMINDIYNSWEHLHKFEYLNYIQNIIGKHKPKTVVCIGISSGGYAAMLYGQLLKAQLVFAFSPQTFPFFNYANYLGHLYKIYFSLGLQPEDSVIRLQNQQGFYAKTYIIVSEYNGMDLLGLNQLNKTDPNLQITYCRGYDHVPIETLGVKNVYQQMCLIIDEMIEKDNNAEIDKNIFSINPSFNYHQL